MVQLRLGWLCLLGICCGVCFAEQADNKQAMLDKVATEQAGWKVGEVVAKGVIIPRNKYEAKIERRFVGVTREGYFRVEEFYVDLGSPFSYKKYPTGTVYSAPFNLVNKADVTHFNSDYDVKSRRSLSIDGAFSRFGDNGNLYFRGQYKQGKQVGYWYFYAGDKVYRTEYYKDGVLVDSKVLEIR